MCIDVKDLYKLFSGYVKEISYFNGWKKSGLRKFVKIENDLNLSIEMEQMTGSFSKRRHMSLTITVSLFSSCNSIRDFPRNRKDGDFHFQWSARNGKGVGHPSVESQRTWWIENPSDLDLFKEELRLTLENDVQEFCEQIKNKSYLLSYIKETEPYFVSLPLILELSGIDEATSFLVKLIEEAPLNRPNEPFFLWCEKNKLLSRDISQRLIMSSMQSIEKYKEQFQEISAEIA